MNIRNALNSLISLNPHSLGLNLESPWENSHLRTATTTDIFYCFRLILGRSPNREEWNGHSAQAGSDLDTVTGTYLDSLECSQRAEKRMKGRQDDSISLEALQDFSMYVQENDQAVGKVIKDQHEYEPHVSAIFRDRLREGMNVLDVGANIGYFTMLASALVKSSGSVIAIEPNSTNVKLIEASRRANGFDNISIIQAAAGRAPGLLVINSAYSNGTTARLPDEIQSLMAATTVACLKIDDLVPVDKKIDFIKIDIEGAELNALTGASELIRRCRPTIVSEFSPDMMPMISGTDGPGYLSFLIDFGYQISIVETLGVITPCGKDISRVMNAYSQSGVDHIDILLD